MANRIQLRRGNAQEWANVNPTLAQGELGIELDTGRFKFGDGVSAWNTLKYERPVESVSNTPSTLVQRDSDGNFAAGTVTATLIGNASTASRLASPRQIQLDGDVQGSAIFDGSQNLVISTLTALVSTLPHYDGTSTSSGTYTKVTVDAKGLVTNASNPTSLADYGLDGTVEGQSAQPYDADLASFAGLTTTGIVTRVSGGNIQTRTIVGTAARINVSNGNAVAANPVIDLITTAVQAGDYNTESLTSVSAVGGNNEPFGTETVNATKFTVDDYGRLTSATNVPIATATEGSKYASYDAGTAYSRYDIIEEGGNVYQALASITAGAGAPSHTSGDSGQWRYLAAAATEQKGLASFAQEDFDVDNNGHVTIAASGVDNTQLQNNRIGFADGNTVENFELDQELTATSGYRGFNYLNYVKVNDTSGNLLFGANNTGDSGAGEIDVNVRSYYSDPNIDLDGAVDQIIDKYGSGHFTISHTQNVATPRNLNILATNSGAGSANIVITSDDTVQISASDAAGKVHVEDARFQDNYIATTNSTLNLDPGDDRATTGLVRVWGDLQVDGVTTTVNSTTMTVDDVVLTLGGDTAPSADDNLDRGVEFNYYDSQARVGFYGWDTNYTDLAGHEGGYTFLHAATNTSETFAGTASGIVAGNLKLESGTASTTNTTGDLVVAGGTGITGSVNIGGSVDIDTNLTVHGTTLHDDNIVIQGASKVLQLNNGAGTNRIELQSTTGNASFFGVVDITNNLNINTNMFNVTASNGNTQIAGAVDANSTLNVAGFTYLEDTDEPTVAATGTDNAWEIQSNDYGAFRFDGGGYIEGDTLYNSDIYINGLIIQKETTTEVFNEQNSLKVRKKLQAGSQQELIPDYASHTNANLKVFGGAGIRRSLHIGARQSGEGLFIGKLNSGSNIEFQVIGDTGNTTIGRSGAGSATEGLLTVYGDTLLDRDLTVNGSSITLGNASSDVLTVNADATFTDNLTVNQSAEFDSSINVDGDATFQSNVTINGDNLLFTIERQDGTDAFTVDSDNGNTVIAGTLDVDDATTITNTLNVTNGVDFDSTLNVDGAATFQDNVTINADNKTFAIQNNSNVNKFTVDTDNGNTDIQGTLNVEGAITLDDTLYVSGNTNIDGTLDVDADFAVRNGTTDKFFVDNVTGDTNIEGTLTADGHTELNSTLNADGATTLGSTLTVTGNSEFNGTVDVDADFAVRSGTTDKMTVASSTGNIATDGTLVVQGETTINDSLIVDAANEVFSIRNGSGVEKFGVDADNGNTDIQGTLNVEGATTVDDTLGVTGVTSVTDATGQTLTGTYGADGALRVTGGAAVGQNLAVAGDMRVYGDFEITGSTTQSGNTGFSGRVSITNSSDASTFGDNSVALTTDGGFRASKNAWVGGDLHIWDDSNSRDTFTVDVSAGTADLYGRLVAGSLQVEDSDVIAVGTGDDFTLTHDGGDTYLDNDTGSLYIRGASGNHVRIQALSGEESIVAAANGGVDLYYDNTLQLSTTNAGVTIAGDLTVNGTTTTVNSTVTTLDDPIITLGGDTAPVSNDAKDRGVEFRYYDGSAKTGFFGFDRSSLRYTFLTNTTNNSEIISGTDAPLRAGSLNLTSSGTALDVDANANIDGTLTVDGQITSNVATGSAPFVVSSTTKVVNLNADQLDGMTTHTSATASSIVARDANGDFASNEITMVTGTITGNATVGGTLGVTGVSTLTGLLNANGGIAVDTNNFTVDGITGAVSTASTLNADGATTLGSTLAVTGATTLSSTLGVTGAATLSSTLDVTGNVTASADLDVTANATVGGTLGVTGATTVGSTLGVTGTSTFTGAITANGGVIGNVTGQTSDISNHDTDALTEGSTNLYFTNERVDDRIDALFVASTGITKVYDDAAGTYTLSVTQVDIDTDNVTEGSTNLFTTAARTRTHFTYGTGIELSVGGELSVTQVDIDTDNVTEGSTNIFYTEGRFDASLAGKSTSDLTEGTNLYYTDARADARIAAASTDDLSEGSTNLYYTSTRANADFDTKLAAASTSDLSEGTNLYYTNTRAEASFDTKIAAASTTDLSEGTNLYYTTTRWDAQLATKTTDDITEGSTNIFYTEGRFDTSLSSKTTDDVTEGSTNLYYTDARADARIAAASTSDLSEGTNLYYTDARADARVAAATGTNLDLTNQSTDDLSEGSTNLYYTDARAEASFDTKIAAASTTDLTEGTNLYYTEARVQDKLDNAFAQLQAMLNNLATTTTLTLNLSGDPTPGAVVTAANVTSGGLGGFTAGTAVTTTGGTGSGLTVDTTVVGGEVTAVAVNAGGSDYLINDTITLTNPNLGGVATFNFGALVAGTQYTTGTGLATTGGDGSNLTVDITASGGNVTGVTVNAAGSGYAIGNTVTIVHPNATGIETVDTIGAADALRTAGTYGVSAFTTTGSGTSSAFSIVVDGSGAATVTVTEPGTGHAASDTITISDANLGGGGAADLTFNVATIFTSDATIDLSTVFTNATFALADITTMEVGATVTGATSGTTGIITALGTNQITVDNVGGFFKVGEVVSANDVTTLTVNSFS